MGIAPDACHDAKVLWSSTTVKQTEPEKSREVAGGNDFAFLVTDKKSDIFYLPSTDTPAIGEKVSFKTHHLLLFIYLKTSFFFFFF